ncbi:crotonase/enoyl-CoA hydratase family protein [Sedimentitalea sp. XS_ASV28]|uniref:crotonase/enoyl-CoA hydratase family protein n=1 Tax=Sedimentitalea sp. XS_ASV28 TaxID=3241296 RepID=UPI0035165A22
MTNFLKYDQAGPVVTLTMNDPDRRNPLTGNSAVEEFVEATARIERDPSVRVVIVTGSGAAFSAGGDVRDMKKYEDDALRPMPIRTEYQQGIQRLTLAMYNLEVPMIAAVNGYAIGAGCDLSCMCDIRIAGESAKFAESFIKLGLIPGDGGAWLLPRVVGMSKAAEMAFTGEMLDAQAALDCGLVSRVVPDDQLMDETRALANRIAANPGPTLRLTKRLLREGQMSSLSSLLELSAAYQALAHKTAEHAEAVNAFLAKRKPDGG